MDQTLHGVKLTYFVLFGALSLYAPYVSVNLDAAGFTKSQIGSIRMVRGRRLFEFK
jgi:MFS_1 like family